MFQNAGVPIARATICNRCTKDPGFLAFVCDMLPKFIKVHGHESQKLRAPVRRLCCLWAFAKMEYTFNLNTCMSKKKKNVQNLQHVFVLGRVLCVYHAGSTAEQKRRKGKSVVCAYSKTRSGKPYPSYFFYVFIFVRGCIVCGVHAAYGKLLVFFCYCYRDWSRSVSTTLRQRTWFYHSWLSKFHWKQIFWWSSFPYWQRYSRADKGTPVLTKLFSFWQRYSRTDKGIFLHGDILCWLKCVNVTVLMTCTNICYSVVTENAADVDRRSAYLLGNAFSDAIGSRAARKVNALRFLWFFKKKKNYWLCVV